MDVSLTSETELDTPAVDFETSASEEDSEADRRAYGVYRSLEVEGEGVDAEAAAYLKAVREEAKRLPNVFTVSEHLATTDHLPDADPELPHEVDQRAGAEIQASPEWIKSFLQDFSDLRHKLLGLELAHTPISASYKPSSTIQEQSSSPLSRNSQNLLSRPACLGLTDVLALNSVAITSALETEIDKLGQQKKLTIDTVHRIYSLAAAAECPLMADAEACMGRLFRHCCKLRSLQASESDANQIESSLLDILQLISGAYFGQDRELRSMYRRQGVQV